MSLGLTVLATLGYSVFKRLSAGHDGTYSPLSDAPAQVFGGAPGNPFHGDTERLRAELFQFLSGGRPEGNEDLERAIARSALHADLFCLMEAAKEPLALPPGKLDAWLERLRERLPDRIKHFRRVSAGVLSE